MFSLNSEVSEHSTLEASKPYLSALSFSPSIICVKNAFVPTLFVTKAIFFLSPELVAVESSFAPELQPNIEAAIVTASKALANFFIFEFSPLNFVSVYPVALTIFLTQLRVNRNVHNVTTFVEN